MQSLSALTIAGSDSGGGAGIQADLKTFAAFGLHGLSVLTALTAQNTRGVDAVHVPDAAFLRAQLEAVFSDFRVGAVKLGMLANAEVIHLVADVLGEHRPAFVVLDPVMVATSGARLLDPSALDALRVRLFPLATLLTPNLPEAELLLGRTIRGESEARAALDLLTALGARAVLLKGGHGAGEEVLDYFAQEEERAVFRHRRLAIVGHGTGCTLAAAITANLARQSSLARGTAPFDLSLVESCRDAVEYVQGALRHAYFPGTNDVAVLDHLWRLRS